MTTTDTPVIVRIVNTPKRSHFAQRVSKVKAIGGTYDADRKVWIVDTSAYAGAASYLRQYEAYGYIEILEEA